MTHDTCNGCLYHLGGNHCEANLELECADGDREMYKATEDTEFGNSTLASLVGEGKYPKGFRIARTDSGKFMLRGEKDEQ